MSNQTSQDMAVAFLLEQNRSMTAQEEQDLRAMFDKKGHKPKKAKAPKAPRVKKEKETVKVSTGPVPPAHLAHVVPGVLGAEGFLKMLSRAKDRNESIEAIHAYVGFDTTKDFGAQEYSARAKAQKELRPIDTREKVTPTVSGYVAGMPNNQAKFRQNLFARERLAVDSHIEHARKAESATDQTDQKLFSGLAEVEMDRLRVIRQDIRASSGHRNTVIGIG